MGKVLAALLIAIFLTGVFFAYTYGQKTYKEKYYEEEDVYHGSTGTFSDYATVVIEGKSGFVTERGKLLSLVTENGTKIEKYWAKYTMKVKVFRSEVRNVSGVVDVWIEIRGTGVDTKISVVSKTWIGYKGVSFEVSLSAGEIEKELQMVPFNTRLVFTQVIYVKVSITVWNGTETVLNDEKYASKSLVLFHVRDHLESHDNNLYQLGFQEGYSDGFHDGFVDWQNRRAPKYDRNDLDAVDYGYDGGGDPKKEGYDEGYIAGYVLGYESHGQPPSGGGEYVPLSLTISEEVNPDLLYIVMFLAVDLVVGYLATRKKW